MALKELNRHQGELFSRSVGFLDDDLEKQNCRINGIKVLGPISKLEDVCHQYDIHQVIIAMPSASRHTIINIIKSCSDLQVKTKILPAVHDLIAGKVSVSSLREVNIEDLLKRDPVDLLIINHKPSNSLYSLNLASNISSSSSSSPSNSPITFSASSFLPLP